ncbi:MAG: ABC transporter ATP-binding protein [Planctomycetaceae bacterium]|nr:ABC transporter ATP-binding protein [Planctomycetaceae bacterium]
MSLLIDTSLSMIAYITEIVRLGLGNLALHKLRSVLTSLGIILGVAAVIVVVSIGEGNKRSALKDIEALGATNIIIRSVKPPANAGGGGGANSFIVAYGLGRRDHRRLESAFGEDMVLAELKATGGEIRRGGNRSVSQCFGTVPQFIDVANLSVTARGRYLTQSDLDQKNPVAVIGHEVARQFFRLEDPIGSSIRINEVVFTVIGVLEPVGFAGGAGAAQLDRDLNKDIHIPISTALDRFGDVVVRRESGSFSGEEIQLSEIYINTSSTEDVIPVSEIAKRIVEVDHPGMRDIEMVVPWELLENAKRAMLVWNIMLISIAAISLLVGGIGIMNIMLATVTERTREIGIRRALGATRRDIILQFLIETGSLSAVGGLLGIALGIGISVLLESFIPWLLKTSLFSGVSSSNVSINPEVTLWSIVTAFLVAVIVGLVFGIYPAIVASRRDPIIALRHD